MSPIPALTEESARAQGWVLWTVVVLCLVVIGALLFGLLRKLLLRPLRHKPTDTTDSWSEAGRRLRVTPPEAADEEPSE